MALQNFDVSKKTVPEFINFCKCLENLETSDVMSETRKDRTNSEKHCRNDNGNNGHDDTNANSENPKKECFCLLHGKDKGHDTNGCCTIKNLAKKQKKAWDKDKSQEEDINAIVEKAVKAIKKKHNGKCQRELDETSKELNALKGLSLSDSDNDHDSDDSSDIVST